MSNLIYSIHLFGKYRFSVRVVTLGTADTAVSNTESPALAELTF